MIYGEHEISRLTVFATEGQPGKVCTALMGLRITGAMVALTRAEVEQLRDLCEEALG
jgi:hypothetical protein